MIKTVLFDFDGTLADSLSYYVNAYKKTMKDAGVHFNDQEVVNNCFGKTEEEICENLKLSFSPVELRDIYFSHIKNLFINVPLYEGVYELLNDLKSNEFNVGLITFAHRWYMDWMLEKHSLRGVFDVKISFNDIENPKPAPDAILNAASLLDVNPAHCLMVGDMNADIKMGKSAGAKTALVITEFAKKYYDIDNILQSGPDHVIYDIRDVRMILDI